MTTLPVPPGQTPRRWQQEATDAIREGILTWDAVVVEAATGTGKGTLIPGIAELARRAGRRTLILTNRDELVEDIARRVRQVHGGSSFGIVKAERDEWANQVVLASVQSVRKRRFTRMGKFDLVLTDEAHHAPAAGYRAIYAAVAERNPAWKHVGFTATPFRSADDGGTTGLGDVFEAVVYSYGIGAAIEAGDLVPLRSLRVETRVDLSGLRTVGGDFDPSQLADVVDLPDRNNLVVDSYLAHTPGQPALAFAVSIAHSQHLAEAFAARGLRSAAVWGESPDRAATIAAFQRGDIDVLCSCALIFEGFDAPRAVAILKARPTKSRVIFTQMIGRGLRTLPGTTDGLVDPAERRAAVAASAKPECIFLDFVDNGVELDLMTAANLDRTGDPEDGQEERDLVEGDLVRRRHHREWGVGVVVGVTVGALVDVIDVEWPPSDAHAHGTTLRHPRTELAFVPASATVDEDPAQLSIVGVDHVRTYEIEILPGQTRRTAIGWYSYADARVCSGKLDEDRRVSMVVRGAGEAWEVWEVVRRRKAAGAVESTATRRHEAGRDTAAMAWADEHLRALGAVADAVDADWKREAATADQRRVLKSLGITREATAMSRGEAAALIDAKRAVDAVREAIDPEKARRARMIRQAYGKKRWQQRAAGGAA